MIENKCRENEVENAWPFQEGETDNVLSWKPRTKLDLGSEERLKRHYEHVHDI